MSAQHTPGEWSLHNDSDDYTHYRIEAEGWGIIAYVKDFSNQAEANARLIAGAPDLLAALEMALDPKSGDWRAVAQDAISKAKGA